MENEWIEFLKNIGQMAAALAVGLAWLWGRLDKKFEVIDKRFEVIDKRFDAIDKRFEIIDRKFEMILEEIRGIRKDISKIDSRLARIEGIYEEKNMGELRLIARGEKQ